jgi:hypothetical protein
MFVGDQRFQGRWELRALIIHLVPSLLSVFGVMYGFRVIVLFMFYYQFTRLKKQLQRRGNNSPGIDDN